MKYSSQVSTLQNVTAEISREWERVKQAGRNLVSAFRVALRIEYVPARAHAVPVIDKEVPPVAMWAMDRQEMDRVDRHARVVTDPDMLADWDETVIHATQCVIYDAVVTR